MTVSHALKTGWRFQLPILLFKRVEFNQDNLIMTFVERGVRLFSNTSSLKIAPYIYIAEFEPLMFRIVTNSHVVFTNQSHRRQSPCYMLKLFCKAAVKSILRSMTLTDLQTDVEWNQKDDVISSTLSSSTLKNFQ